MRLVADGDEVVVTQETGATVRFGPDGEGGWVAPARFSAHLVENGDGTVTFTRNRFEHFTFEESTGRLLSIADRFGDETTLGYAGSSVEAEYMEDPAGRRLTFGWSGGRLVSVTDPLTAAEGGPRVAQLVYDGAGDLVSYTDLDGGVWGFGYDSDHLMVTQRKPRHSDPSMVLENSYDGLGRVVAQEDELGRVTAFEYDVPAVGATRITMPDGSVRVDEFVEGRRERTTVGVGSAAESSTVYGYDADTLALVSVTDNDGKVTSFTNDGRGNRLSVEDPTGRISRFTYNDLDLPLTAATGEIRTGPSTTSTAEAATSEFIYTPEGLPVTAASGWVPLMRSPPPSAMTRPGRGI